MKPETLIREYLHADSLDERRILSICAANMVWALEHAAEQFPTKEFLDEFMEPFIQYEKHKLQRIKLQHITQTIAKGEEQEHAEAETYWAGKCIETLKRRLTS